MDNKEKETKFAQLFTQSTLENPITASGRMNSNGFFDINYSSVLTRLIQEAGRYCERYASDLFVDWNIINTQLNNGAIETSSMLFGFRESGVDHTSYVMSSAENNPTNFGYKYRSVWRLDIERDESSEDWDYSRPVLKMKLIRVNIPSDNKIREFFKNN